MFQLTTDSTPASIIRDHNPHAAYVPVERYTELKTAPVYAHYLNTRATVTTARGPQEGEIIAVVPDPFGTTDTMCYVVSLPNEPYFNEYVPIRSVPAWHLADCTDCGQQVDSRTQMCSECGYCLACCDCPPSHLDDDDFPYYAARDEDAAYDEYRDRQAIIRLGYGAE